MNIVVNYCSQIFSFIKIKFQPYKNKYRFTECHKLNSISYVTEKQQNRDFFLLSSAIINFTFLCVATQFL